MNVMNNYGRMKLLDIFYIMPYYPPPCKDTSKLSVQVSIAIVVLGFIEALWIP